MEKEEKNRVLVDVQSQVIFYFYSLQTYTVYQFIENEFKMFNVVEIVNVKTSVALYS